jgi:hypothetical protein
MRYGWYFDGREEVFSKVSSLGVAPGETVLVEHHELVYEVSFDWPKEIAWVHLVDKLFTFERIATGRAKGLRVGWKEWKVCERVANNVSYDSKAFGEVSHDWTDFLGDRLVLLFSCEDG